MKTAIATSEKTCPPFDKLRDRNLHLKLLDFGKLSL